MSDVFTNVVLSRWDVFAHFLQTGETNLVSKSTGGIQGAATSSLPSIPADGRFVSFTSVANNLVPGTNHNMLPDVLLHDILTGETILVSVDPNGNPANEESFASRVSMVGQPLCSRA